MSKELSKKGNALPYRNYRLFSIITDWTELDINKVEPGKGIKGEKIGRLPAKGRKPDQFVVPWAIVELD